jgi:MoaA/NifB/PqqE/SkfB family radical SAM enzyme
VIDLSSLLERIFRLHEWIPRTIWPGGRAFAPVHTFIEVTYRCNLRCNFCQYLDLIEGRAKHVGPNAAEFTSEEILKNVDEVPYGRLISFAGGETLVRKDFPRILEHASRRHRTHVITNGSLIDAAVARHYVGLAPRWPWQNGLVLVGVSMEGTEAAHDRVVQRPGSWRRTVDGIRHMVRIRDETGKAFPKFNLKLVVTRDTVDGLVDFMHLAHDLGVDVVNFMAEHDLVSHAANLTGEAQHSRMDVPQAKPEGVDPERLRERLGRCFELAGPLGLQIRMTPHLPIEEFARHYSDDRRLDPREYVCGGAWSRFAVGADGRYTPACYYLRTGDVRNQSMAEVWNGPEARALRREIRSRRVFAGCNGCCNLRYTGPRRFGLAGLDAPGTAADAPGRPVDAPGD